MSTFFCNIKEFFIKKSLREIFIDFYRFRVV